MRSLEIATLCRTCQDTFHKTPWNDTGVHSKMLQIDSEFVLYEL